MWSDKMLDFLIYFCQTHNSQLSDVRHAPIPALTQLDSYSPDPAQLPNCSVMTYPLILHESNFTWKKEFYSSLTISKLAHWSM